MTEYNLKNGGVLKFIDGKLYVVDSKIITSSDLDLNKFDRLQVREHPAILYFEKIFLISKLLENGDVKGILYYDLAKNKENIYKIVKFITDNLEGK